MAGAARDSIRYKVSNAVVEDVCATGVQQKAEEEISNLQHDCGAVMIIRTEQNVLRIEFS